MRWLFCAAMLVLAGCVTYSTHDDDDADDDSASDDDSAGPSTGVEVQPPDLLDFGTVEECTAHAGDIVILNHGPDTESVQLDAGELVTAGFTVDGLVSEVTLAPGDEHVLTVGLSPGPGGAGEREAHLHVITVSSWFDVLVLAEVVAGDEC